MRYTSILAAILLIAGCKTNMNIKISESDLAGEPKEIPALLDVEVPGCSQPEDSRKESEALEKVKKMIPEMFGNTEFKECYTKGFESFAQFQIPVSIMSNGKLAGDNVGVYRKEGVVMGFYVPKSVARNLAILEKENMLEMTFGVIVDYKNNGNENITAEASGVYIDDKPYVIGEVAIKKTATIQIRSSNLLSDYLRENQSWAVLKTK